MAPNTRSSETVELRRPASLPGVELLRAHYVNRAFPRHAHAVFAIGVIDAGALGFNYRGARVVAARGEISLANDGEAHDGFAAAGDGWQYRMLYLDPALLGQAASELAGRERPVPRFAAGVIRDPNLARCMLALHAAVDESAWALPAQELLALTLTQLVRRHADDAPPEPPVRIPAAVRRAREAADAQALEGLTLRELAGVADMNAFQFLRAFRRAYGLTPYAYVLGRRIAIAQALLARGQGVAEVAARTGFADQSHLSRHFRRIVGVTPGAYRQGEGARDHD